MDSIFFNVSNLYFIIFIIFFLGGVVKGTIGVGLPTITIGLLIFFFDIKESISLILVSVILTNLFQVFEGNNFKIVIKDNFFFLVFSSSFIIPGIYLLKILNSQKLVTKSDIVDVQMIYSNNTTCNFHINRISNIKQKSITLITEKNCYLWENNTLFKFSKKNNTFKKFYESKNTALENECKSFSKEISGQIKSNNAQISLEIMKDLCTIL